VDEKGAFLVALKITAAFSRVNLLCCFCFPTGSEARSNKPFKPPSSAKSRLRAKMKDMNGSDGDE
jgi:hypothetical protein